MSEAKCCQNCKFHTQGVGAVTPTGVEWKWQECTKQWGGKEPVGVLKNLCGTWKAK